MKGVVTKINKETASNFMKQYELMGNIGLGVWHYGLFVEGNLVSAVSYGTTCSGNAHGYVHDLCDNLGCRAVQICRGATRQKSPKNAASKLISESNKELSKKLGNIIIIAFADPEWNEYGDVYQASNAIYTGLTDPKNQSNYIVCGEFLYGWQVYKKYNTRCLKKLREIDPNTKKFPLTQKHRYILLSGDRKFKKML